MHRPPRLQQRATRARCTLLDDVGGRHRRDHLAELLQALLGPEITPVIADCLYTGLSTDTGCFLFGNTTARTHKVAAALMEAGARVEELNPLLFENKSKGRIAIERTALENLEYFFDEQCALISMTREQIAASGVSVETWRASPACPA